MLVRRRKRCIFVLVAVCIPAVCLTLYYKYVFDVKSHLSSRFVSFRRKLNFGSALNDKENEHDDRHLKRLTVIVNNGHQANVTGLKNGSSVYLPFAFVRRYFDVYGDLDEKNDNIFHFNHAYGKRPPVEKYNSTGVYMDFNHVCVENRDRVKYVSGTDNVPLSIQWNKEGYVYPTQVAQYCLAHYSRWVSEVPQHELLIENGSGQKNRWVVSNEEQMSIQSIRSRERRSYVLEFNTLNGGQDDEQVDGVSTKIDRRVKFPVFVFPVKFFAPSNVSFRIELNTGKEYVLVYSWSYDHFLHRTDTIIYYGIGQCKEWHTVARNVVLDVYKGVMLGLKPSKARDVRQWNIVRLLSISLSGHGQLDSLILLDKGHIYQMKAGADWLVNNVDENGGWPVNIKRVIVPGMSVAPGWYSAMGQGQAMSCLCRLYKHTGNRKYLDAALKATKVFDVLSENRGVLARFAGTIPWYEEYPTQPPSFVLNGFMYSLIGLYDLSQVASHPVNSNAKRLYEQGLASLRKLLLLYDLGLRTAYDLRHISLYSAPRVARWDYHIVHVTQLLTLGTIDHSTLLWNMTAERWELYMHGYRAPHN